MTAAEEKEWWKTQSEASKVKALIVSEYFPQYCKIIKKTTVQGFTYLDFWAGRGKYDDGNLSTPLLLADIIGKDDDLRPIVQFCFNDLNNREVLENNFLERFPEGTFENAPRFASLDAANSPELRSYLNSRQRQGRNNRPTLLFFDPFGYKGIDTASLANFMKPFGNELFLFLNVTKVIPALTNPKMLDHVSLMLPTLLDEARDEITAAPNAERKVSLLIEYLTKEFKSVLGESLFSCAFKFRASSANRTSHLIVHFSKHPKGFKLAKQVFHDYDNIGAVLNEDGTYTFDAKKAYGVLGFTNDDNHIILAEKLAKEFSGQQLSAYDLIEQHQQKTLYAQTHYVNALRRLVSEERLNAWYTDEGNHRVSVLALPTSILKFP